MRTAYKLLVSFILLYTCTSVTAQYCTQPLKDNIKALTVSRSEWNISYPVIYLNNAQESITINFDLLDTEMHQVTYSIVHCDAEWMPSDLSVNEYLDGFQSSYADIYDYSYATNIDYINYSVHIPNDDVQLKVSGNYTVIFYDEDDRDTLLTACFSIVEPRVNIFGTVGGIASSGHSKSRQQLNFTVNHANYSLDNPLTENKVVVLQNNDIKQRVVNATPTYIHTNKLIYDQNPKLAFLGGDEYHTFETSSLGFSGEGVARIDFFSPFSHVTLRPSQLRYLENYEYDDDIDGKFLIRRQESDDDNSNIEADYIVVHFTIPMENPILDGKVYIGGGFTYNISNKANQMTYNTERKAYEASYMIKQGYYNYHYYIISNRDKKVTLAPIELSSYQTENDYQIFFYHRPMGERYDRLIGYKIINTLK